MTALLYVIGIAFVFLLCAVLAEVPDSRAELRRRLRRWRQHLREDERHLAELRAGPSLHVLRARRALSLACYRIARRIFARALRDRTFPERKTR